MEEKTISIGEFRVRTKFNPSQEGIVEHIKQKTANIINIVSEIRYEGEEESSASERSRLVALALTKYEEAAMFAVKAATCIY
jgi:hypothetical protein